MPLIANAQTKHDPEEVFAYQGEQVLTQSELDGAFHRIPEDRRLEFVRDGEKVQMMLTSIMVNKIMAADASKSNIDTDPVVRERLKLAVEEELALIWKDELQKEAPDADYEAMAYEHYLSKQEEFMSTEVLDVSHILISVKERDYRQALEIAENVLVELDSNPERFEELVIEYSEDSGKDSNKGRLSSVVRGQTVKPFERAVFSMKTPGEISRPVKTEFGYHIIRFNGRQAPIPISFERVKPRLVERAKADHKKMYRDNYMSQLLSEPLQFPEGSLEIMIRRYFGEDLELAPDYSGAKPNGDE